MSSPNQGIKGVVGLHRFGNMTIDIPKVRQQKSIDLMKNQYPCQPLSTLKYGKPPQCCK